jgi:protein required for attachment to host cells
MATTWIVAADSSRARVLQVAGRERLVEIDSFLNPRRPARRPRTERRYDELVIVAPPKFLGTLRGELGKETAKLVVEELPKDLSWLNDRELERYFAQGSAPAP